MKKSAKLNDQFSIEICEPNEETALNALYFEAKPEWVFVSDQGDRFSPSSRYIFWTYSKPDQKGIQFGTAKAAIQAVLIDLISKHQKLSSSYFKIIEQ